MATINIFCTSNSDQTGIIIYDKTDWTALGVPRSTLNDIKISLYQTSLVTPTYPVYTLTEVEEAAYITDGQVEISFLDMVNVLNLSDYWWTIKMTANTDTYISNFSGFGIYSDITYAVWNEINGLHVPEENKYDAEKYCRYAIYLKGLGFLDTTNVNSRDTKFKKRLTSLQKMLLNI